MKEGGPGLNISPHHQSSQAPLWLSSLLYWRLGATSARPRNQITLAVRIPSIRAPGTYASWASLLWVVPEPPRSPVIPYQPALRPHVHTTWGWKPRYLVKHILQLVLCQGTTLDVLDGAQLLCHPLAIFLPHRLHLLLRQLVLDAGIISQIDLRADYETGDAGTVVVYLGEPFLANVLERCRGGDAEANEEDIGLWVGQGSQSVVIFLTGGIEQAQRVWLVADPRSRGQRGRRQRGLRMLV